MNRESFCRRGGPLHPRVPAPHAYTDAGLTLLELMAAIAISGLISLGVLFAARIGMRAWEKGQHSVLQLRRVTNVEDVVQRQIADCVSNSVELNVDGRRYIVRFFFAEERRLVFLSSYSARAQGRGGLVVADYFAEQQPDGTWKLWLDERPALDDRALSTWAAGIERSASGEDQIVLRPPDSANALLLWEDLRECRFQYRRETPLPAGWVGSWPGLWRTELPSAVALEVQAGEAARFAPVSLTVALQMNGVVR